MTTMTTMTTEQTTPQGTPPPLTIAEAALQAASRAALSGASCPQNTVDG